MVHGLPLRRGDFLFEVLDFDERTGTFRIHITPDPRRYEWTENEDGERLLYDRLDDVYITMKALRDLASQMEETSMTLPPEPRIADFGAYAENRRSAIAAHLGRSSDLPEPADRSAEFLDSLASGESLFVIMSVDVVDSTQLAGTLDAHAYALLVDTVLQELSAVVAGCSGHVLKYTGDGLIAYFAESSFTSRNDLALYCARGLGVIVRESLNPALLEHGFPAIEIRIGMDAGEASIRTIGSPTTKRQRDIIGEVVNLAVKIQEIAPPGGAYVGHTMHSNLHVQGRLLCELVPLGDDWAYNDHEGSPYPVYSVRLSV